MNDWKTQIWVGRDSKVYYDGIEIGEVRKSRHGWQYSTKPGTWCGLMPLRRDVVDLVVREHEASLPSPTQQEQQ